MGAVFKPGYANTDTHTHTHSLLLLCLFSTLRPGPWSPAGEESDKKGLTGQLPVASFRNRSSQVIVILEAASFV